MLKRNFVTSEKDIPENWRDRLLILWKEDDVPCIDKEGTDHAFERITGSKYCRQIKFVDEGDCMYYVYYGGWVKIHACDGGSVGVLVK